MTFSPDLETKIIIAEAAVSVRQEFGPEWTLAQISQRSGLSISELFLHFPSKRSMLDYWYQSVPIRYRFMIDGLEGYDELTLAEKLSNFMLTVLDMMDEQLEFVQNSYDPIIFKNQNWHPFRKECALIFKEMIESHAGVSQAAKVVLWDEVYDFLTKEFLHVIKFKTRDKSENGEKTLALVDKFTGFIAELLCNKTIDSGIDLARFFWQEGIIKVDITIPFIGRIKSGRK